MRINKATTRPEICWVVSRAYGDIRTTRSTAEYRDLLLGL